MRREEIVEESDSTDNPSINGRYHRFNVKLGKGAFKEVYKAFDTHEQIDVAWNSIDLSLVNNEDEKKRIFKETLMLRRLNHANILKITNQWFNDKTDKLCFITNIVHDGSLSKFFKKRQVNLLRVKQICKQILNALLYLHSMGVIHRDLKCDNIFIEGNTGKVVLGDLGLSCNVVSARSIVGTPHWMAPELYREDYNEMVDIWSFGMCVLELITSLIPYSECKGAFQVYQSITAGKKPESLKKINDPYVRAFVNICLNVNPQQRPSARELLDHPFLYRKRKDTTLCSQLMIPKEDQTEPPLTMEEKREEEQLQNTIKDQEPKPNINKKKRHHDFHCERSSSPAPPQSMQTQTNMEQTQTQRKKKKDKKDKKEKKEKKEKVDIKFVKNNGDTIRIKLQIVASKFGKPMNVEFDFCHTQEEPSSVAQEMVRDLELASKFTAKVEKAIKFAIAKAKSMREEESTTSTKQIEEPVIPPATALAETKSRKSLKKMTLLQYQSEPPPTAARNLNPLPVSSTSLTPDMRDDSATPPHKTVDPMYSIKPTPMSQRMFGFAQNETQSHTQTDYLTSDPPPQQQYNMPMVRNGSSPDPPLTLNGYDANLPNKHRESLSNSNEQTSLGSIPQPQSASNSQILSSAPPTEFEPPKIFQPSQSLPQQPYGHMNGGQYHAIQFNTYVRQNGNGNNIPYVPNGGYPQPITATQSANVRTRQSQSVPNKVPTPQGSPKGMDVIGNTADFSNMTRSVSQPAVNQIHKHSNHINDNGNSARTMPNLPPIPDQAYSVSGRTKYNRTAPPQKRVINNIAPPKSTTPPTPPPVIGIQGHEPNKQETNHTKTDHNNRNGYAYHPRSRSSGVLGSLNGSFNYNNPQPRSRSASPGPEHVRKEMKNVKFKEDTSSKENDGHANGENKENVTALSDGRKALQALNNKSSDKEIFRVTLKLTEDELIQEFVKRSKKYNKSEGKTGLARKLVNVLIEEMDEKKEKEQTASPTAVAAQLELPKKEQSPDSVFSMKSTSIESAVSIETQEQLMKKRDSGRDSVLKLKDYDSGTSSHDYDVYTNNQTHHGHSATTVIHHTNAYNAMVHDKKSIKASKSAHALAPSGGYPHGLNHVYHNGGHTSTFSSASGMSTVSTGTILTMDSIGKASMNTVITRDSSALSMGYLEGRRNTMESTEAHPLTVASLDLPFVIEELKLPSPSPGIVFDDDVWSQISIKQLELHNEYIDFVKRKYELLQLRFTTLEAEYKDNNSQQMETKRQEENGIKEKINNKRIELTAKFGEWLSDREQIALLKQRIEKKRSNSMDKLPAFDLQLEFENDPQFTQLMESQLSDTDKRECKLAIHSYRKDMMNQYKNFYVKTIQTYKDKAKLMMHH
eukprot:192760_1